MSASLSGMLTAGCCACSSNSAGPSGFLICLSIHVNPDIKTLQPIVQDSPTCASSLSTYAGHLYPHLPPLPASAISADQTGDFSCFQRQQLDLHCIHFILSDEGAFVVHYAPEADSFRGSTCKTHKQWRTGTCVAISFNQKHESKVLIPTTDHRRLMLPQLTWHDLTGVLKIWISHFPWSGIKQYLIYQITSLL